MGKVCLPYCLEVTFKDRLKMDGPFLDLLLKSVIYMKNQVKNLENFKSYPSFSKRSMSLMMKR